MMEGVHPARVIVARTAAAAATFTERTGRPPCLATVLVGDDPASVTYVPMKRNRCAKAGIDSRLVRLPAETTTEELVDRVAGAVRRPRRARHPAPASGPRAHRRAGRLRGHRPGEGRRRRHHALLRRDGLRPPGFVSGTPGGIMRLLDAYGVELTGRHAVVIGRSPILGKPMGMLLLARDATVTYCHSRTDGPARDRAPPPTSWSRPSAARVRAGRLAQAGRRRDRRRLQPRQRRRRRLRRGAGARGPLTPVPGGVGPMTIAVLLEQTVRAASEQILRGTS